MIKMALIDLLEMENNALQYPLFRKIGYMGKMISYSASSRINLFITTDQERFHTKEKVLFWPDLATNHYSHKVMDYLDDNEVQMVHKEWNPQNCPESRAIETL
ncbi:unnamed protein product [Rotaria socialis]|uniref:Uncharacterized protein n=1 Tax=Rotaria socialis TaxID=392032 RepID=A0A820C8G4_9BILA|nr:unnamed protein product [Rotaria socialis]CAF4445998.1 unnamed protein product [Rotaria socialis]CAF4529684.1 unnamed protein product [Rotaria socialis]